MQCSNLWLCMFVRCVGHHCGSVLHLPPRDGHGKATQLRIVAWFLAFAFVRQRGQKSSRAAYRKLPRFPPATGPPIGCAQRDSGGFEYSQTFLVVVI